MLSPEELELSTRSYETISNLIKNYDQFKILHAAAGYFNITDQQMTETMLENSLHNSRHTVYDYALKELRENIASYDWLYHQLQDKTSIEAYTNLIRYRILPDLKYKLDTKHIDNEPEDNNVQNNLETVPCLRIKAEENTVTALLAVKDDIADKKPGLTISLDHNISNLWVIPRLIYAIDSDYQFYVRQYCEHMKLKTVLYAIPAKPVIQKIRTGRKPCIVAMAPYERPWSDVELVKECGLMPYLLYKNHGCEVVMAGAKGENYLNAKFIQGVKLEFLPDGKVGTKVSYIKAKAKDIDCLWIRGCYESNFEIIRVYKAHNPDGKVFCGLDANSRWMDRIAWYDPDFQDFLNNCDVLSTSCTAMAEHLTKKWQRKVFCHPNGFYNLFPNSRKKAAFEEKENVILTVARLGTRQKATDILLLAFAQIAARLPDWRLRLVGSIEPDFQEFLSVYKEKLPWLLNQIEFVGSISDKYRLMEEYESAKIFALPSLLEGGSPNVIGEALAAGCVCAVTKIDAYEDIVDGGRCGCASEIGDTASFAENLYNLCTSKELAHMSENCRERAATFYNMEHIVEDIYGKLGL